MREILFKAKRLDNGEWAEGFLVKRPSAVCIGDYSPWYISVPPKDPEDSGGLHNIDPATICQYTGLTDKKGKKIWENDVVKHHFREEIAVIKFGKYQNCFDEVKTGHVGFYVDWKKCSVRKDLGYWVEMIDCNVIGNIFDHPELLRGEE